MKLYLINNGSRLLLTYNGVNECIQILVNTQALLPSFVTKGKEGRNVEASWLRPSFSSHTGFGFLKIPHVSCR